jgi:hypothetical protein
MYGRGETPYIVSSRQLASADLGSYTQPGSSCCQASYAHKQPNQRPLVLGKLREPKQSNKTVSESVTIVALSLSPLPLFNQSGACCVQKNDAYGFFSVILKCRSSIFTKLFSFYTGSQILKAVCTYIP